MWAVYYTSVIPFSLAWVAAVYNTVASGVRAGSEYDASGYNISGMKPVGVELACLVQRA